MYDLALIKQLCDTLGDSFNIMIAKDQFIEEMEAEENLLEGYIAPLQMTVLNALNFYYSSTTE